MKGRTRSFFEDILVLLVIASFFGGGYYLFFYDKEESNPTQTQYKTVSKEPTVHKEIQKINSEQEASPKDDTVTSEKVSSTKSINKESNEEVQSTKELEKEPTPKISKEPIEPVEQNDEVKLEKEKKVVDLAVLRQFKKDVYSKIASKIVLDQEVPNFEQNFSIRVTVLKNGFYEQLIFTGGNKTTFENNLEKISSIFPLKIDESIEGDFPRYLRYSFSFEQ